MTTFTPWASLVGGALIGLSAVLLLASTGRIAGISGFVARLFPPYEDKDLLTRVAFVAGVIAAPFLLRWMSSAPTTVTISDNLPLLAFAGALVGFGSAYGSGCTSGHGVCGIARLSQRSFVATAMFMAVAMATVFVVRHVMGG
jgi:uncharacterized protein